MEADKGSKVLITNSAKENVYKIIENDSNWKESLWIGLAIFVSTLILFILVFVWLVCAPLKSFTSISVMQKMSV